MPSTGLKLPAAVAQSVSADIDWTNINNVLTDNATNVTVVATSFSNSEDLQITQFGISLPSSAAVVKGVIVEIDDSSSFGAGSQVNVSLTKDGTTPVGTPVSYSVTGLQTLGSATSLWGTTLTKAEVEASTFGVLVTAQGGDPGNLDTVIDYVKLNVYYEEETAWLAMGTFGQTGTGSLWFDEENVVSDDATVVSSADDGLDAQSMWLTLTNMGAGIPTGATINGFEVKAEIVTNTSLDDISFILTKNLSGFISLTGVEKITNNGASVVTLGSPTDMWSTSLTEADVNHQNFGVAVKANDTSGAAGYSVSLDYVFIKVYYTSSTWTPETNSTVTLRIVSPGARWI
jgi:hypothetical protein